MEGTQAPRLASHRAVGVISRLLLERRNSLLRTGPLTNRALCRHRAVDWTPSDPTRTRRARTPTSGGTKRHKSAGLVGGRPISRWRDETCPDGSRALNRDRSHGSSFGIIPITLTREAALAARC